MKRASVRLNEQGKIVRAFLIVLLAGALAFSFVLLRPFLGSIILAILLAGLSNPVFRWILRLFGGRKTLAALIAVLLSTVIIVVPVFVFLFLLLSEGAKFARLGIEWIGEGRILELLDHPVVTRLETWMDDVFGDTVDLRQQLLAVSERIGVSFVNAGVKLFGNAVDLISDFGIFVFVLFFLYRDGDRMIDSFRRLLPMRRSQTDRIFAQVNHVTRAVLFGTFLVALIQGALGGIGLAVVGIPALVWGTAIGFSSMIPIVGTFLITAPVTAYLFISGSYWQGAFFSVWALVVIGGIDNILRPLFMKGRAQMSPFFVFLGVIGGVSYFGMSGLIYGPLIIALTMVVLTIYRSEFASDLRRSRR